MVPIYGGLIDCLHSGLCVLDTFSGSVYLNKIYIFFGGPFSCYRRAGGSTRLNLLLQHTQRSTVVNVFANIINIQLCSIFSQGKATENVFFRAAYTNDGVTKVYF